jgi:hypothetical protein
MEIANGNRYLIYFSRVLRIASHFCATPQATMSLFQEDIKMNNLLPYSIRELLYSTVGRTEFQVPL